MDSEDEFWYDDKEQTQKSPEYHHSQSSGADSSPSLEQVFADPQLDIEVIGSRDEKLQSALDDWWVPWGTQWEIYRGLQNGHFTVQDVLNKIQSLSRATDADKMHQVKSIITGKSMVPSGDIARKTGAELDREQAAIVENRGRGLGLMGIWHDSPDWYGGKVQQVVKLAKSSSSDASASLYTLKIHRMTMTRSNRLARYLGSRRIIQLKCSEELMMRERDQVLPFLRKRFVFAGRVFLAIPPKDNNLYLIETNQDVGRCSMEWCGDQYRLSYAQFISWMNPSLTNRNQPLAKYFARFHIALSTSIPALEFDVNDIHYIDDIHTEDWGDKPGKPPSEKITTDGCGFINFTGLKLVARIVSGSSGVSPIRPTAIQGRIGGAKGLWILHPSDNSETPIIWIRKSQLKIRYPRPEQRSYRILDLLHVSNHSPTWSGPSLSRQSILNLSHNCVPTDVLVELLERGLREQMDEIVGGTASSSHAPMLSLTKQWDVIHKIGGVGPTRMSRLAGALSRAMGFEKRRWGKVDENRNSENEATQLAEGANPDEVEDWGDSERDLYSGKPISIHETILEMLQAGFSPQESSYLNGEIRQVLRTFGTSQVEKLRISVGEEGSGVEAYAIPDPLGVLEPNQIYFRSTEGVGVDPRTMQMFHNLTGDVLIFRYPLRLPSDVQKVTAINIEALAPWSDVIIVPTKGGPWKADCNDLCSLMSVLGGGDNDGDTLCAITTPSIVGPFESKRLTPPPRNLEEDNFDASIETVSDFLSLASHTVTHTSAKRAQENYLGRMLTLMFDDGKVGLYSVFHDASVYRFGYGSKDAIRLAYMDNILLDAPKTGLRLKPEVLKRDQEQWGRAEQRPQSMGGTRTPNNYFILDILTEKAVKVVAEAYGRYDELAKGLPRVGDRDLLKAWQDFEGAKGKSGEFSETAPTDAIKALRETEFSLIKKHVERAYAEWRRTGSRTSSLSSTGAYANNTTKKPVSGNGKAKSNQDYKRTAQIYASEIPGLLFFLPSSTDLRKVKASYAYKLGQKFAFSVAFRDLLLIKAEANLAGGGIAPSTIFFDQIKSIGGAGRRVLAVAGAGGDDE